MISLSLKQSRQLEKHILSKKEHAKLFLVQMFFDRYRNTAWYAPSVPDMTKVVHNSVEYDFEHYKLSGAFPGNRDSCVVLIPRVSEKKGDRLCILDNAVITDIYHQLMRNIQKYGKEPWSLYEKTWRIEKARLLRQKQ